MKFNKCFLKNHLDYLPTIFPEQGNDKEIEKIRELIKAYTKAVDSGAMFDARCFNIPKEEVCNLIYWRQLDAIRNSIQMLGQAHFSHKELQGKSCNDIKDMLIKEKGIDWNSLSTELKRGSACIKVWNEHEGWEPVKDGAKKIGDILCLTERSEWVIDKNMPILKGEFRKYIDKLIYVGE